MQVEGLTAELLARLGPALLGLYLHGSLAMGCFNPSRSDIDLVGVLNRPLTPAEREGLIGLFLERSGQPSPVEISFITTDQMSPWRFPSPFDFHYSEGWRERLQAGDRAQPATDPELAAHLTILHRYGTPLIGPAIGEVFPPMPRADYLAAIWTHDTQGAVEWIEKNPVYGVLNLCRVLAHVVEGLILSKADGGRWALAAVAPGLQPVVAWALDAYERDETHPIDPEDLRRFAEQTEAEITRHIDQ